MRLRRTFHQPPARFVHPLLKVLFPLMAVTIFM